MEQQHSLSAPKDKLDAHPLAVLRERLSSLADGAGASVTAGHVDLAPDVWLSTDPAGQGAMSCQPGENGFVLRLQDGDSGGWACLGMRFSPRALVETRYLGLLVALTEGGTVSVTPTLRYLFEDGMRDVPAAEPVFLTGNGVSFLAHIPVDAEALEKATGCELNLFFHDNAFMATFRTLEPLRII